MSTAPSALTLTWQWPPHTPNPRLPSSWPPVPRTAARPQRHTLASAQSWPRWASSDLALTGGQRPAAGALAMVEEMEPFRLNEILPGVLVRFDEILPGRL